MSILSFIRAKMREFDILSWYSFIFACIFVAWLVARAVYRAMTFKCLSTSFYLFLKHFAYPNISPRLPFVGTTTPLHALLALVYTSANIAFILKDGIKSKIVVGNHAATLSIINIVPLLCGPRLLLMTEMLGASLRTSLGIHRWLGRTAIVEVLIHTIISLTTTDSLKWTQTSISGVTGSAAIGFILVFSNGLFRRRFYEWFLNSHQILSMVMLIAIGIHIFTKQPSTFFLQIGMALWLGVTVIHWILFAYRNLVLGRPFATALVYHPRELSLEELPRVLQIDINVPRKWQVKAGQYILLSIPKLGVFSGFRGHPFMISWWKWNEKGLTISLLVKVSTGLTSKLSQHIAENPDEKTGEIKDEHKKLLVFIDGPYGIQHNFGDYGTVIMFATGIGIAAHIPYIKDLMRGYSSYEVKTRRILLVWEIDKRNHLAWVKPWMDDLIKSDTGFMLRIRIYARDFEGEDSKIGKHSNGIMSAIPPNITSILETEFATRQRRVIVSVCAHQAMADKVRQKVHRLMNERVRLVELDFQPSRQQTDWPLSADMDFECRGWKI